MFSLYIFYMIQTLYNSLKSNVVSWLWSCIHCSCVNRNVLIYLFILMPVL